MDTVSTILGPSITLLWPLVGGKLIEKAQRVLQSRDNIEELIRTLEKGSRNGRD